MRWASTVETDGSLTTAVERAAEAVFHGLGRREPDLLTVFVSNAHAPHYLALPELVRREFDNAFLFGCCASGVIGGGREVEDGPALAVTGAVLPGVHLKGMHLDPSEVPPMYTESRVWEDALHLTARQEPALLVLADPFSFEAETFLKGLDRAFPRAPKAGGLASGAAQPGGSVLYLDDEVHRSGVITLALTGNVEMSTVVAQGCRPVGDPMFATLAHENLIRELDGRCPRDAISELFERSPPADRELFGQALFLGLAMRPGATEYLPGDFLVRNILGMDPESGALWINARVPENSVVQFHLRDATTSAFDLERALAAHRLDQAGAEPAGALLFSCVGRGAGLYGQPDHDTNAFRRLVADVPVGGFFCGGEIGPVQDQTCLHGYTSVFAVFREK